MKLSINNLLSFSIQNFYFWFNHNISKNHLQLTQELILYLNVFYIITHNSPKIWIWKLWFTILKKLPFSNTYPIFILTSWIIMHISHTKHRNAVTANIYHHNLILIHFINSCYGNNSKHKSILNIYHSMSQRYNLTPNLSIINPRNRDIESSLGNGGGKIGSLGSSDSDFQPPFSFRLHHHYHNTKEGYGNIVLIWIKDSLFVITPAPA